MSAETYDVVIVGSGAAGGMAAYALAKGGAKVCLLEAGRHYDPETETPMTNWNHEAPLRGSKTPDKDMGFYDATVGGGWQVPGEPYASAPGSDFRWWRARMLGGRTNHWGRLSLRYAAHDFKAATHDGIGVDWPFDYAEFAPWYDKAERLVGIVGNIDGLDDQPDPPPGVLHTPPVPRSYERLVIAGGKKLGRPVVANRAAVITRPIDGRQACFYASPCSRGCSIKANFQSTTVLLPPALATGNLTIVTDAMVREVAIGKDGLATGVHYVDRKTRQDVFVGARTVVLGASAYESVRILMNSRSAHFPHGIGADGGLLGRCIADNTGGIIWGQFPQMERLPAFNEDGISLPHIYIPWWGLKDKQAGKLDFPRGYHIETSGGRAEPGATTFDKLDDVAPGTYGAKLKDQARRYYGSFVRFAQRGETIMRPENRIEIDGATTDKWGIPTLRFHYKWSDAELAQTRHARTSILEFIEASGGKTVGDIPTDPAKLLRKPGEVIHELGGARAGTRPDNSVTDPHGQVWGVPNLHVVDGAVFATNAHKNPTLTIIAFAWRASAEILRRSRDGRA